MTEQHIDNEVIDQQLFDFVDREVLPGLKLDSNTFWHGLANLLGDFAPYSERLLVKRKVLDYRLNHWQATHPEQHPDMASCNGFLKEIGFLADEGPDFTIKTERVDSEIAEQAGPQMLVPLSNARYALKAANARWGSLYDALYGSDAIAQTDGLKVGTRHNQARANRVIRFGKEFLDQSFPLDCGSHQDVTSYLVYYQHLLAVFPDGSSSGLKQPEKFVALSGHKEQPTAIVLKNNGLHVVLEINRHGLAGCRDLAGVNDIQVEAALSSVLDMSADSQTTTDKIDTYRNWLGLMQGNLHCRFDKDGKMVERHLLAQKQFTCKDGGDYVLPGHTLLMTRNPNLDACTTLVRNDEGQPMPEAILDTVMTALIAMYDRGQNSRCGNIYIVQPQLQGPEEVEFTCALFGAVEDLLGLERNTLKLGLGDESPRTAVNLKECIRKAEDRLFLLDNEQTGRQDERSLTLIDNLNLDVGLACGLSGKAQIGKGMWPEQKQMARMLQDKRLDVQSGASCARVPSPTAAILHAMHYHQVDVFSVQRHKQQNRSGSNDARQTLPLI